MFSGLTVGECFQQLKLPAGSVRLIAEPTREPSFIINENGKFVPNMPAERKSSAIEEKEVDEIEEDGPVQTEKEKKTRDNIKLIQKLTTYLPQHLVGKAKDQIRQMSNVDKIEEFQDRLLVENRKLIQEPMTADQRWDKLENTLSVTHGIDLEWKKLGPGMWIY